MSLWRKNVDVRVGLCLLLSLLVTLLMVDCLLKGLRHIHNRLFLVESTLGSVGTKGLGHHMLIQRDSLAGRVYCSVGRVTVDDRSQLVRRGRSRRTCGQLVADLSRSMGAPLTSLIKCLRTIRDGVMAKTRGRRCVQITVRGTRRLGSFIATLFR